MNSKNLNKYIGKKIKFYRNYKRIAQVILSEKLQMSRSNMAMIETGKIGIKVSTLLIIANILNINVIKLIPIENICKTCGAKVFKNKCEICGSLDPAGFYD